MGIQLGLKIKQLRSDYGLIVGKKFTQNDLANKLNISRSYLGDIESGRTNPSDSILFNIANELNADYDELLKYKNNSNRLENSNIKYKKNFNTPEEAIKFLLLHPCIMKYCEIDKLNLSEDDLNNFSSDLLIQIKNLSYKYILKNIK